MDVLCMSITSGVEETLLNRVLPMKLSTDTVQSTTVVHTSTWKNSTCTFKVRLYIRRPEVKTLKGICNCQKYVVSLVSALK